MPQLMEIHCTIQYGIIYDYGRPRHNWRHRTNPNRPMCMHMKCMTHTKLLRYIKQKGHLSFEKCVQKWATKCLFAKPGTFMKVLFGPHVHCNMIKWNSYDDIPLKMAWLLMALNHRLIRICYNAFVRFPLLRNCWWYNITENYFIHGVVGLIST